MSPHASGHMGIAHWYVQILGCVVLVYLGVSVSKFLIGVLSCGNRRHGEVVRSFSAGLQPLAVGCLELQQRSVEDPHYVSYSGTSINRPLYSNIKVECGDEMPPKSGCVWTGNVLRYN